MRTTKFTVSALLLVAAVLLTSCSQAATPTPAAPAAPPEQVPTVPAAPPVEAATPAAGTVPSGGEGLAARVNGQPISLADYQKQLAQFEAALQSQGKDLSSAEGQETLKMIRQQVLDSMIDQVLIEQGAAAAGVTVPESVVTAHVEKSIQDGGGQERFVQWLAANGLTEQEYYETVRSQLLADALIDHITAGLPEAAPQVRLRQILVSDGDLAAKLWERLKRGESFDALAERYSEDESTRHQGGDLGWFPLGYSFLAPEVEEAASQLRVGEISAVIKAPYGYYIIQVTDADPNRPLTPEMRQALRQQKFMEWLDQQRKQADIERFVDTG